MRFMRGPRREQACCGGCAARRAALPYGRFRRACSSRPHSASAPSTMRGPARVIRSEGTVYRLPRWVASSAGARFHIASPGASSPAPAAAHDDLGILLQHRLDADRRRQRRQVGEHVDAAAQPYRVADDLAAVERVQRLVPDLVEHRYRRRAAVTRRQRRQPRAQCGRRRCRAGFGAGQLGPAARRHPAMSPRVFGSLR